jgi:hypothetical protein
MSRTMLLVSSALLASLAAICIAASEPAMAQNTDASVTSYIKALNASMPPSGDPDVVANAFTENGVHHGVNQGPPQVGREQIRQFFAGFKNTLSDWTHIEKTRLVQGNRAVWEVTTKRAASTLNCRSSSSSILTIKGKCVRSGCTLMSI